MVFHFKALGMLGAAVLLISVILKISRASSPHFRITSNHSCAMAPNSPPCSFIHASMAGSCSAAPLNRSNCPFVGTSHDGPGATFHFTLPTAVAEASATIWL